MHIVIDARIIHSTTGRYVERLLHYLQQIDTTNQYTVLIPSKDKDFWQPSAPNFSVQFADFANYSWAEQVGFKKFLDSLQADLVHFCMPQQPVFYKGAHVTTFHDLTLLSTYNSDKNWLVFHIKQMIGRFVFHTVARTSRQIITPTQYVKHDVARRLRVSEDKITVTYEAADTPAENEAPYELPFSDYILYVGQQSDYKNIKRLGEAHQELLKSHPNLGLVLVGSKNASALKNEKYFTTHNFKNIIYTGFVSDAELTWLFRHCRAYIFPSLMEGFGLPGLEAMACGAAVVSSNATCLPEVYEQAARYFNPTDTEDIARVIQEVLDNEEIRAQLLTQGATQVQKYSWKRMAEQTHQVYLKALK
jgi:glycosyltransferase involved in cell wall biosynthesis